MRGLMLVVGMLAVLITVACAPSPAAPQQPAAPAGKPAAAPAAPAQAPAQAAKPQVDADVQQVYDQFVKKEMPKVPIELVQAAKREGALSYYHLVTPGMPKLAQEFGKVFPFIKVQVQQLNGGPLVEKYMAESRAGQYLADVAVFSSLSDGKKAHKEGFVMQYAVSVEDELPKKQGVSGYIVPLASTMQVIPYNAERIKDADAKILRQWEGLLDARWNGKRFTIGEVMAGGTTHIVNFYFYKTFGTKMWERLAKESYAVFPGINPQLTAVVAGERDLAVHGSTSNIVAQWEKGAPVHWQYAEPHVALPYAQFINAKAPHPNAAKLFQEFAMSIPGQQILAATGTFSYRKGTKETGKYVSEPWYAPPDSAKYWDYDDEELAKVLPDLAKQWRAIFK